MTTMVGVYGAGGCGRGILPLLREHTRLTDECIVFIDDDRAGSIINGHEIISYADFLMRGGRQACLAVSDGLTRQRLDRQLTSDGVSVLGVRAPDVFEMDDVDIGPGALLSPHVGITSNIRIGRCFHANLYSYVEHDCRIGDYVTFAPRVNCNGNVTIGDFAYIGTGAMMRQGISIGAGAVVGMGAVVVKDVPAGMTVVGNPARQLIKVQNAKQ